MKIKGTKKHMAQELLPDVAQSNVHYFGREIPISRVGMSKIDLPIKYPIDGRDGYSASSDAKVEIYVSLDKQNAKGIHMSRLYNLLIQKLGQQELSPKTLATTLIKALSSHKDLSNDIWLRLEFPMLIRSQALLSENFGWKSYPCTLELHLNKDQVISKFGSLEVSESEPIETLLGVRFGVEVVYSSTCPCSAALSRQLIQENFVKNFGQNKTVSVEAMKEWLGKESAIIATPHGQRSSATIMIQTSAHSKDKWTPDTTNPWTEVIHIVENALSTPVQAAVKRIDEQEFARLNGSNLMFAEDAIRKIASKFTEVPYIHGYKIRCDHFESLHAHDAVAQKMYNYINLF